MRDRAAEAVQFLSSLPPSTIKLGLERIREALDALAHPEAAYPAVHVAGTNGKGSTCAFTAACLHQQGLKVGLYTSPHLVRINERIQVAGQPIPDDLLGQRVLEVLDRYPRRAERPFPLTYFELGTLVALWHFQQERVDVAVLETGLGGRLDATNCARPAVTAITPISFDHMDLLGHTLDAIAREKAGICKPGVPCVVSRQPDEALRAIQDAAAAAGAPLWLEGRDFELTAGVGRSAGLRYRGRAWALDELQLSLRGAHQIQNAAVALACLEALATGERGVLVSETAARAGLRTARWPGRLEEISSGSASDPGPPLVLDGAHNPGAMEALCAALDALYPGRRLHAVFGVLADKDLTPMAERLFPRCASLHLCPLPSPRSLHPSAYAARARALCPRVQEHVSVEDALAGARAQAGTEDVLLATGSLVLVGAVRALTVVRA